MRRFTCLTAALVLVTALATGPLAQDGSAASKFKVGQKVWVLWPFEWQEGEIVEICSKDVLKVRVDGVRAPILRTVEQVRPFTEGGKKPPKPRDSFGDGFDDMFDDMGEFYDMGGSRAERRSATPYKKDERVEADWGKWEPAVVLGEERHGWIDVRILSLNARVSLPLDRIRRVAKQDPGPDATPHSPSSAMRTWRDVTGNFEVEAKLVKREGDQVTIERAGGEQVSLPLAKLCRRDRKYVEMFADGSTGPGVGGAATFDDSTAAAIDLADPGKTSVPADGVADLSSLTKRPIQLPVDLGEGGRGRAALVMAETKSVLIHRPSARAFVSIFDREQPGQVVCFDLKRGKVLGTLTLPEGMYVADLSPSGLRMLVRGDRFSMRVSKDASMRDLMGDQSEQVYLWGLGDGPAKQVAAWQPYSGTRAGITMTAFLDDNHVVTAGGRQSMIVWETAEQKAVYSVALSPACVPAVSPGGKQIALASKEGIFVIDANSGTPLAKLPGEPVGYMQFSFRSDGRQLAAAAGGRLQVWDLEKGTRIREIRFTGWISSRPLTWVGPEHILVNGTDLVDLQRRVVLWRYQWQGLPPAGATVAGLYWTFIADVMRGQRALVAMKLPHPVAVQAAERLAPESILAVKPGSEVSVQVSVAASAEEQQAIRNALVRQLEENGVRVVDGGKLVLKAGTGQGETVDVTYRSQMGRGGGGSTQVTEQVSTLAMTEGGHVLWQVQQVKGAPMFVQRTQDESLDSAIAKKLKPSVEFFLNIPIPKYAARPGKDGTYGTSMVSMAGFRTLDN